MADRQRLRQMLFNLVSNGIKYNRRGGTVWVTYEAGSDETTVTVRDNGHGIPLEAQAGMFTPFDRLGAEGSGVDGTGNRTSPDALPGRVDARLHRRRFGPWGRLVVCRELAHRRTQRRRRKRHRYETHRHRRSSAASRLTIERPLHRRQRLKCAGHRTLDCGCGPGWRLLHASLGGLGCRTGRGTLARLGAARPAPT